MRYLFILVSIFVSFNLYADNISKLYEDKEKLQYDDLVVDIRGYKVPTRAAFKGWVLLNHAEDKVKGIADYFRAEGIEVSMPLYLILLQGTDWVMNNTSLFTLPNKKHLPDMVNTIKFIQQYIEPEIGIVIPVSGERSAAFNKSAGGAGLSKHLIFCALDMVPREDISRPELHKKLKAIHKKYGAKYKVGLGLYSGVRFHIDTCGYRAW
ncbi:hypothetical protein [Psychromonas ossibalaenae]|uniref:hypothetical protein n=1 Tax=Psychromonas ossibalaenae TaxID=444922 RepID=UPI00036F8AF3|nr:hypothetical protein [Psychromonas ossibalaenae]